MNCESSMLEKLYGKSVTDIKVKEVPARASFNPVSTSGMLGTNTPGVSKTYMLGLWAI